MIPEKILKQNRDDVKRSELINKCRSLSVEEIVLHNDLTEVEKGQLLVSVHGFKLEDAKELIKSVIKAERKAKLKGIKTKLHGKVQEMYGIPSDEERQPISDDVRMFVWQRDKGRCVKCGGNEKLEYDHIIPFSKGGSNTQRNIQLLCEKCNREKGATI